MRLINHQKPARPAEITKDNHWDLIETCWSDEPADRPTAGTVLQVVQQFLEEESEEAIPLVDPYSQRQAQYSPTTNSYPYDSSADHQRTTSGYPSHPWDHALVKSSRSPAPASSPHSPVQQQHPPPDPSSYGMGSTSPHPASQSQSDLSAVPISHQNSLLTPNVPLSYGHQLSPVSQYYPQEQQMVVELPVSQSTKHSGFRRVRDTRDLRPYINPQPAGRRMDSNGVFLSVRHPAKCL
jgi:dual specificity protein kinase YAK1